MHGRWAVYFTAIALVLFVPSLLRAQSPCDSSRAQCVSAVSALVSTYDTCRATAQNQRELLGRCEAQLQTYQSLRENADAIAARCNELRETTGSLVGKYDRMLFQSTQIETLLQQSLTLSQTSVRELDAAIVDLNAKYNTCVKDCMGPFYTRWPFWAGVVSGAVLGGLGAPTYWAVTH